MPEESKATGIARKHYDRLAAFYDLSEAVERVLIGSWQRLLWSKIEGQRILEVGVGTGKNFPYYPAGVEITAIDFSPKMLQRAQAKAAKHNIKVTLHLMDVQKLLFADDSFDTVVASFVFCSVPDPIAGLKEIRWVCRPGGKVVLLEHVRSANRFLGRLMDLWNPLTECLSGVNINRRTVDNVVRSGLRVERVSNLRGNIFLLIEARNMK